jgi:hypothetical protein
MTDDNRPHFPADSCDVCGRRPILSRCLRCSLNLCVAHCSACPECESDEELAVVARLVVS